LVELLLFRDEVDLLGRMLHHRVLLSLTEAGVGGLVLLGGVEHIECLELVGVGSGVDTLRSRGLARVRSDPGV